MATVLILGGTSEARELATRLVAEHPGARVITSLAGVTTDPNPTAGEVRTGGFGGQAGLAEYLQREHVDAVVDATHPFAQTITEHAVGACADTDTAYLRLERKPWTLPPDTDVVFVPDAEEAAGLVARTSKAALLTIGVKELGAFEGIEKVKLVARVMDEPAPDERLAGLTYVVGRPPFDRNGEIALMRAHHIDTLVTKASGGDATRAKLDAAQHIGARIVMLRRPAPPKGAERVFDVHSAVQWANAYL